MLGCDLHLSELKSFDRLLEEALYGSKGFYENECLNNHFITPSVGAEAYSAIIAQYAALAGLKNFCEYGAGTGILAKHLAPHFEQYQIIEKSSYCRSQQQQLLGNASHIFWEETPHGNEKCLVLLQEVFDCLPEKICFFDDHQPYEVYYDRTTDTLCSQQILKKNIAEHYYHFLMDYAPTALWQKQQKLVLPIQTRSFIRSLYHSLGSGSQFLIIDYGYSQPELSQKWSEALPLRSFQHHHLTALNFKELGKSDITYDIDFYYLCHCWLELGGEVLCYEPLGKWLAQQAQRYDSRLKILIEPRFMGASFKILILSK